LIFSPSANPSFKVLFVLAVLYFQAWWFARSVNQQYGNLTRQPHFVIFLGLPLSKSLSSFSSLPSFIPKHGG
jgi:hypothetical protein